MLILLFSLCSSYSLECSAPLKHAEPLKGGKLVSFVLFLRHGMRTPLDTWVNRSHVGQWICDSESAQAPRNHYSQFNNLSRRYFNQLDKNLVEFPPNCQTGDLLVQGMQQHYELGRFYQRYLQDELRFLPRIINPNLMYLRSSFVERTFRSAESFLSGFYPPAKPNESLNIITGTDTADYLYPESTFCSDLAKDWDNFLNSDLFEKRMEKAAVLYKPIYDRLNITFTNMNWMFLGDFLSSFYCTGQDIPIIDDLVTDEVFEQSQKDISFFSYGFYSMRRGVSSSAIFRDLFNLLENQYNGKSKNKFFLFSAHDSTIISILTTFGIWKDEVPTFRSHLAFEIWEKDGQKFVRFVLNGEIIAFGENGETVMKYREFKTYLSEKGYLDYCKKEYNF